jgi:PKD repeat protein
MDGTIVSYFWDFGDQSTSNEPNPSHVYNTTGSFTAILRVFDNDDSSAEDSELIVVNAASSLFYEDFSDADISDWQQRRGNWNVLNQTLNGQARRKAEILSPFAGCENCAVQADFQLQSPSGNVSMLGWYLDPLNSVQLTLMGAKDKVVLKQRAGGKIVLKSKSSIPIEPGIMYGMKVVFDGTLFSVYLDGNVLFTTPSSIFPFGKFGFRLKGLSAANSVITIANLLIQ